MPGKLIQISLLIYMNYSRIYKSIIDRALSANRSKQTSYYERHHITPKSLGGTNARDNTVLLTAKEHIDGLIAISMLLVPVWSW